MFVPLNPSLGLKTDGPNTECSRSSARISAAGGYSAQLLTGVSRV